MSAHTPGPWVFETRPDSAGRSRPVVVRSSDLICAVSRGDQAAANARLIAAAPELLAALKKVGCRMAKVYLHGRTCLEVLADEPEREPCFVCAAIAKAEAK